MNKVYQRNLIETTCSAEAGLHQDIDKYNICYVLTAV